MTAATDFWTGDRGSATDEWIDHYWESWQDPHRQILVDLVRMVGPVRRVLEIGCNCGPNLRRLLAEDSQLRVVGLDCNAEAIEAGRARLNACGFGTRAMLMRGEFPQATLGWETGAVDVAVTCYAMAYVEPSALAIAISEMCRLAPRAVILMEPHSMGQPFARGQYIEWHHDYEMALKAVVKGRRWWHYAIDPVAKGLNAAFIIGPRVKE